MCRDSTTQISIYNHREAHNTGDDVYRCGVSGSNSWGSSIYLHLENSREARKGEVDGKALAPLAYIGALCAFVISLLWLCIVLFYGSGSTLTHIFGY